MILRLLVHLFDDNRGAIPLKREGNGKGKETAQAYDWVIITI